MYILSANIDDLISLWRFCPEKWKLQLLTVVKIMLDYLLMRTSWYSLETISGICDAGYEMFSLKNRFSFRMHSHWRSSESSKLFLTHERVESLGNWENLGISAINLGFVCLHFETTAEISLYLEALGLKRSQCAMRIFCAYGVISLTHSVIIYPLFYFLLLVVFNSWEYESGP